MTRRKLFVPAFASSLCVAVVIGSIAIAKDAEKPAQQPAASGGATPGAEVPLPPGWTPDDVKNMIAAGIPGEMHQRLAKDVGTWQGKNTMWMFPGAEPMQSECTATITSLMDGRYVQMEMKGEIPGMGPFTGLGIQGYDNVAKKFASTWIDSQSTGIMTGTGELSPDGKTINWNFKYHCPVTGKPTVMRQIETNTGPNAKTLEMHGIEPKSGKEFKMMVLEMTTK